MKKILLISCLFLSSLQIVNAQDNKDKTSTSTDGKTNTTNQSKDTKVKLDNLFNSALNDFKSKQYDKSLATIAEAETIIKNNNINTEKRFADLKEAVLKSKNSTSTSGNNKGGTSNPGNSELKAKLDNLFQSALMDYKAGQYDKSLASISNAEQLLKNNNMTDVRFSDLKNSVNQARSKQSNTTNDGKSNTNDGKSNTNDGKTNTNDGKSNTNDGKSNTNDGKTNTNDGKTNTNDGKTNTNDGKSNTNDGKSNTSNQSKDTKVKLDNLFNSALNDFKSKQYDKSLATIAEAETIIKNNNINSEKRFADLKEAVLKSKNSTSTSGNNKGGTSNPGNSELKAKLDNLFQSALMDYKAGQYDKSLASISNAEQLLKNNNMTDVRFSDLKNSVNQARSKQSNTANDGKSNTNDGKSNTNDGKSNTNDGKSNTGNTSNNDVKTKLENYYKDAVSAVNMGKYDVATSIINDAESLMKSTNTVDNRFDNLKKEIALKTKK